jgi:2-dehydropantoate 2-reductase
MRGAGFSRYELRARDVAAARAFYAGVLGEAPPDVIPLPPEAAARGAPPHWLGHLGVEDVERAAAALAARGATRLGPARPMAGGGEVAVLIDAGGAVVALSTSRAEPPRPRVAWHVLLARDLARARESYREVLGWQLGAEVDLGAVGVFQELAWDRGAPAAGAMGAIGARAGVHPQWLFHFAVPDLDAALDKVRAAGGVVADVVAVPRVGRVAACDDPQGAAFGLCEDAGAHFGQDSSRMRTLVVGVGALGGIVAARLRAGGGARVWLATRDAASADRLKAAGLRVTGVGGDVAVEAPDAAPLDGYREREFDLVVLATKAQDAIEVAPRLPALLRPGGTLLPIQNGGVPQLLSERLGECVLGGLSNLGATMAAPGAYEQRNAGHLLVGELAGGASARAERVRAWLGQGVEVRVTENLRGAVWSKLLLNCSVTTLGAVAGRTMREYVATAAGREVFDRAYDEALAVALAGGARPERMLVDPVPPGWSGRSAGGAAHEAWLGDVLRGYGDIKPSMLQDLERGRPTEIEFVNGHVVRVGRRHGVATPVNAAIVETVHAIERGELAPDPALLERVLAVAAARA